MRNDMSMNRVRSLVELRMNDRKWHENDRMLRAKTIRNKSWALFRSLTVDRNLPVQNNVEYLYFQIYTHNTGIYNTMTDEVMDAEMSEWAWWQW